MRNILLLLLLTVGALGVQAQDKIFRKNGKTVEGQVIEVGIDEVKYKIFGQENSPIYVLEKDRISKIVYANGRTEKLSETSSVSDPERYIGMARKAIKIDFIGPLIGYSQIGFEKSTAVGKGYEVTLAIIGAGKNQRVDFYDGLNSHMEKRNQFGVAASYGYKFIKRPDFLFNRSTRFTHVMQGSYLKPIIYLGNYSENRVAYKGNSEYVLERDNITFGALQLELGRQWIFGESVSFDFYYGIGYGFDNKKQDGYYDDDGSAFNYLNARGGRSPGFSVTWGVKLGLLLKEKKVN